MLRFILTRLGHLVPTFVGVTLVAFGFIRLIPGDPIEVMVGERGISPERHQALLETLGFDRPLWEQYLAYLGNLFQGDLGSSIVTKRPVLEEFLTLFPATIELSLCAIILAVAVGLPFNHVILSNGFAPAIVVVAGEITHCQSERLIGPAARL